MATDSADKIFDELESYSSRIDELLNAVHDDTFPFKEERSKALLKARDTVIEARMDLYEVLYIEGTGELLPDDTFTGKPPIFSASNDGCPF